MPHPTGVSDASRVERWERGTEWLLAALAMIFLIAYAVRILVTVSTVGYGDHFPVTGSGRLVGAGLMVGGVALLGVVTAAFASWLVDRVRAAGDSPSAATRADLARLSAEMTQLRELVEAQHRAG